MKKQRYEREVLDPQRWGLPREAVVNLADQFRCIWERFRGCFKTKTRDPGKHAYSYLRGLLTMKTKRNYANIARRVVDPEDDGQNLQQFMSDSPWSDKPVFDQIQKEISQRPELGGGMLTLDESGNKKAGDRSAGAGRQYLGRWGKVDLGQVGVGLGYYQGRSIAQSLGSQRAGAFSSSLASEATLAGRGHSLGDQTFVSSDSLHP